MLNGMITPAHHMLNGMIMITPAHHAVTSWFDLISALPWKFVIAFALLGMAVSGLTLWLKRKRRSLLEIRGNERRESPWLAESLLCIFARAKDIEALMGDFEELFARDCASGMSQRRAVARYWARVLRSIGPQMMQAIKRVGWLGLIAAALRR